MSVLNQGASKGRASRRSFLADAAIGGLAVIFSTQIAPSITRAAEKKGSDDEPGRKEDLIYRSASELARLIRFRSISSVELVRAHLSRISVVYTTLNTF